MKPASFRCGGFTKAILFIFAAAVLTGDVSAARVGVVVTFPGNYSFIECVDVPENTDGYGVLRKADLSTQWGYDPEAGHLLCKVFDTGCMELGCRCLGDEGWNIYFKRECRAWVHLPVGLDGGASCGKHYCAKDGDMLGLAYGKEGVEPAGFGLEKVCMGNTGAAEYREGSGVAGNATAADPGDAPVLVSLLLMGFLVIYFVYKYW